MKRYNPSWLKALATYAAIGIATLALVDAALYFFLPANIARQFVGYRLWDSDLEPPGNPSSYPRDYFMAHPTRGFDLRPGARGTHTVDGFSYPVWVNRLGCFDREWDEIAEGYYYFAGDSSTWGYTPFEQKFASRFEQASGIPSVKCGVTHTGQRHQFEKFLEITRRLGRMPSNVVVGFSPNDIANDFAHPHSTVIDGWLADDILLDATTYESVRIDREWIAAQIVRRLVAPRANPPPASFKSTLMRYSISAQVARSAVKRALQWLTLAKSAESPVDVQVHEGRMLRPIYSLEAAHYKMGIFRYLDTPFTLDNRRAIQEWRRHAQAAGYNLTFVLIPYREVPRTAAGPFEEVKAFLGAEGIRYIDLFAEFRKRGIRDDDAFWQDDGHMSPGGNAAVAQILLESELNPRR